MNNSQINIEIIAAWENSYQSQSISLARNSTVSDALEHLILEIEKPSPFTGYAIYGVVCQLDTVLQNNDRLELLRPLKIDPKQARRQRANTKV